MQFKQILSSIMGDEKEKTAGSIRFINVTKQIEKEICADIDSDINLIDLEKSHSPLSPFLDILSQNPPTDESIDEAAYTLQANTFKSYFKNGLADERIDMISYEEIFYEKIRYRQTIIKLLHKMEPKKYLILNAQRLCEESVEILKEIEKDPISSVIVFCFDLVNFETENKKVSDYFNEISMRKNYFDVIGTESKSDDASLEEQEEKDDENSEKASDKGDDQNEEKKVLTLAGETLDFDALLNLLHNDRIFLDINNGRNFCDWVERNLTKFPFSTFQMRQLYLEIGIMFYYAQALDEAALYLNYVMEIPFDDETEILALIYIAEVFLQKKMEQTAIKYSKLAKQKLQNNKNSPYYALALMLDYGISVRSTDYAGVDKYNETLAALEKNGFVNSYANVVLVIPWAFVNDPTLREVIRPKIETAFEIAKKIDNQFCLSTVCHWKGIMASFDGKSDDALKWFAQCDELRVQIGDLDSIIKIRNGLSYEYLVRAEYEKSYSYINDFINQIEKMSDYAEVIITLKNMAHALSYGHSYDKAYLVLKKIVQFIHIFGLETVSFNSFFPEYNDILLYKTLIDAWNEDYVLVRINLHNITHNDRPITPVEKSLLYLVQAIMAVKDRKIDEAQKIFSDGIKYYRSVEQGQEHRVVFIYFEFALTLNRYSHKDLAANYYSEGYKIATDKGLKYYTNHKTIDEYNTYLKTRLDFPPMKVDLDVLAEKAEKDRLVNQFHKRLHDYQFLNKIMIYGTEATNLLSYTKQVMQSLFDYAMANSVFLAEKAENSWRIVFSLSMSDFRVPDAAIWDKFISKSKKQDLGQLILDRKQNMYFCNISRFNYTGGVILVPEESNPITVDSLNILNIALSNIQAQIVMFKQNEHLLYISSTDQLSLLKNRRALQDQLSIEHDRLRRYKTKNKSDYQETIAFMDLDNFKFYNDTYGHEVGDLLISSFAKLLTKVFRKLDFIARFGGDEFICILSETSCEQGQAIAQRLYRALDNEEHFIPKIESFLKKKIDVPDNRHLSFSMGLCSNRDIDDFTDMEEVMASADKALYYSKEHGKSCVTLFRDVKSLLDPNVKSRFEKPKDK